MSWASNEISLSNKFFHVFKFMYAFKMKKILHIWEGLYECFSVFPGVLMLLMPFCLQNTTVSCFYFRHKFNMQIFFFSQILSVNT